MTTDPQPLKTPILFLIFNRPEMTRRVFDEIRKARPERLFIAADGPRPDRSGDGAACLQTRKVVARIDWPCEVKTLFREKNLGCRSAVSSAIDWFFSQTEEGIILEDDCLPDQSFFRFCRELLIRYRDDERVMMISGDNFQKIPSARGAVKADASSYYFSRYAHIWGWATWRRAWHRYDITMSSFPAFKAGGSIAKISRDPLVQDHWLQIFNQAHDGMIDTWDIQWAYALSVSGGLAAVPNRNLVENIGFDEQATHTKDPEKYASHPRAQLPIGSLVHPETVVADSVRDAYEDELVLQNIPILARLKRRVLQYL